MDKHWRERADEWIFARLEDSNRRLENTEQYQDLCRQQGKREAIAEKQLLKLKKQERLIVRRYYEYDSELRYAESAAAYEQGWRDGAMLMAEALAGG